MNAHPQGNVFGALDTSYEASSNTASDDASLLFLNIEQAHNCLSQVSGSLWWHKPL